MAGSDQEHTGEEALVSQRTALVLLSSVLAGTAVGALSFLGGVPAGLAAVSGLAAFGASVLGLDRCIHR
ncbi:hypothetical protein GCM10010495_69570 [Kitasatospora herbaricolor]|nr:hypothetical protein GCM10010495_69570 [Kitasatospora herbaricolor]